MIILSLLVVAVYSLAVLGLGLKLQRWITGRDSSFEAPTAWTRAASAFLLGQAAFANLWLMIGLLGALRGIVVGAIVGVVSVLALFEVRSMSRPLSREARDLWSDWRSESIPWKLVTLGTVVLLLGSLLQVVAQSLPPGDAEAFYMALPKVVAAEGRFIPLPGYESLSVMGLVGEMHWAALMTLGLETHVRIFAWPTALATAILLAGLAAWAGLGRRSGWMIVTILFTSLGFTGYIWDGKVDTFGTALGVAAYFWAIRSPSGAALRLTGVFAGMAIMAKASLIVPMAPGLLLLLLWNDALREPRAATWRARIFGIVGQGAVVTLAAFVAAAPQMLKNAVVFGEPLAPFAFLFGPNPLTDQTWFPPATTRYIVATYPLALVYGKYPMMGGGVSPLALMFLPLALLLPRPANWSRSRLVQLSTIGLFGVFLWVLLRPSVLAPRYIFPPLMLVALPAAAAVEEICRRPLRARVLATLCVGGILMTQLVSVRYWVNSDDLWLHTQRLYRRSIPEPKHPTRLACEAVNEQAKYGERVLMANFYRFWLRPDLLRLVDRRDEVYIPDHSRYWGRLESAENAVTRWKFIRDAGFRFVIVDANSHARFLHLFGIDEKTGHVAELPSGMSVQRICVFDKVSAYRIDAREVEADARAESGSRSAPKAAELDGTSRSD